MAPRDETSKAKHAARVAWQAREARRILSKYRIGPSSSVPLMVGTGFSDDSASTSVPREAFELFLGALELMSRGHAPALRVVTAEMTTTTAAAMLQISRPTLVSWIAEAKIPARKVGRRWCIALSDVRELLAREEGERRG